MWEASFFLYKSECLYIYALLLLFVKFLLSLPIFYAHAVGPVLHKSCIGSLVAWK